MSQQPGSFSFPLQAAEPPLAHLLLLASQGPKFMMTHSPGLRAVCGNTLQAGPGLPTLRGAMQASATPVHRVCGPELEALAL